MMKHIDLSEAYELAKTLLAGEEVEGEMLAWADHVKQCDSCYEMYSVSLALMDLTSPEKLAEVYAEKSTVSVISVIKDKVSQTISAIQDYARDLHWQFELQPTFAGARDVGRGEEDSRAVLQNSQSKYSRIIARESSVYILIENDGVKYIAECETEDGKKYTAEFVYDEYEDMLVAEIKGIAGDSYKLRISESDK